MKKTLILIAGASLLLTAIYFSSCEKDSTSNSSQNKLKTTSSQSYTERELVIKNLLASMRDLEGQFYLLSEENRANLYSDFSSIQDINEIRPISEKYFGSAGSNEFLLSLQNYYSSVEAFAVAQITKNEFTTYFHDNKPDPPFAPCKDPAGYAKCHSDLMDGMAEEIYDELVDEVSVGAGAGAGLGTTVGAILAAGSAGVSIPTSAIAGTILGTMVGLFKAAHDISSHYGEKQADCFKVYCQGFGGASYCSGCPTPEDMKKVFKTF